MAEELDALCLRMKYLGRPLAESVPLVVWVRHLDQEKRALFPASTPQVLDVINPMRPDEPRFIERLRVVDALLLNTPAVLEWLPPEEAQRLKSWVIPHHHCNVWGDCLPEERLARPRVVGYVGEESNLHDAPAIRAAVEKLGLEFRATGSYDLRAYRDFDIGIAWTRPDPYWDQTRSNVKFANFTSFGLPSVVPDYLSYRTMNERLGGQAGLLSGSLEELLLNLERLVRDEGLRRSVHEAAKPAFDLYSRREIAEEYRAVLDTLSISPESS